MREIAADTTPEAAADPVVVAGAASASLEDEDKGDDDDVKRSRKGKGADLEDRRTRGAPKISRELGQVKVAEDATLRQIVENLGAEGSYQIQVKRLEPEAFRDPVTRQMVPTAGHLRNYSTPVDEEILQRNHGGGKFQLIFKTKGPKGGFVFFTSRTIDVVGDPRLDDSFRNVAPLEPPAPVVVQPAGENPSLVKEAFQVMRDQIDRANNAAGAQRTSAPDQGTLQLIALMREQTAALQAQLDKALAELAAARNQKPETDPFKDMMLKSMFENESARILALRTQHEGELRVLKENHNAEIREIRAAFERDRSELKQQHENMLTLVKQTHEIQLTAAKGAYETNMKLAEHENRRVEKENLELKNDNKELRAKKEKGPLEIVKEAEQIKDALGVGDGEDKGTFEKVMEALPDVVGAAKTYFEKPQAQQAAATGTAIQPKKRIVQAPDGQKYVLDDNGQMRPVKKKPPPPPQPGPNGEPPIPVIPEEQISSIIGYLERAFASGQEPEIVAQSGRAMVPEAILTAIRDHTVDGFLSKVAKLPSTSPLANQAGKNWVRKVGKALVGD